MPLVPVHHLAGHIESLVLQHGPPPLPYPEQRRPVEALPNAERFFLGGVAAPRARKLPAAELVRTLVAETEAAGR